AAGQAAGPVGEVAKPPVLEVDLVVEGGAGTGRAFETRAEFDALDRVDAEDGEGEAGVELAVPVHVAAEPGRCAGDGDAEGPSQRVAPLAGGVYLGHHALARLGHRTADR